MHFLTLDLDSARVARPRKVTLAAARPGDIRGRAALHLAGRNAGPHVAVLPAYVSPALALEHVARLARGVNKIAFDVASPTRLFKQVITSMIGGPTQVSGQDYDKFWTQAFGDMAARGLRPKLLGRLQSVAYNAVVDEIDWLGRNGPFTYKADVRLGRFTISAAPHGSNPLTAQASALLAALKQYGERELNRHLSAPQGIFSRVPSEKLAELMHFREFRDFMMLRAVSSATGVAIFTNVTPVQMAAAMDAALPALQEMRRQQQSNGGIIGGLRQLATRPELRIAAGVVGGLAGLPLIGALGGVSGLASALAPAAEAVSGLSTVARLASSLAGGAVSQGAATVQPGPNPADVALYQAQLAQYQREMESYYQSALLQLQAQQQAALNTAAAFATGAATPSPAQYNLLYPQGEQNAVLPPPAWTNAAAEPVPGAYAWARGYEEAYNNYAAVSPAQAIDPYGWGSGTYWSDYLNDNFSGRTSPCAFCGAGATHQFDSLVSPGIQLGNFEGDIPKGEFYSSNLIRASVVPKKGATWYGRVILRDMPFEMEITDGNGSGRAAVAVAHEFAHVMANLLKLGLSHDQVHHVGTLLATEFLPLMLGFGKHVNMKWQ